MTYRQGWDRHLGPAVERREQAEPDPDLGAQSAIIDAICKGRKYEGERWWEPFLNGK